MNYETQLWTIRLAVTISQRSSNQANDTKDETHKLSQDDEIDNKSTNFHSKIKINYCIECKAFSPWETLITGMILRSKGFISMDKYGDSTSEEYRDHHFSKMLVPKRYCRIRLATIFE